MYFLLSILLLVLALAMHGGALVAARWAVGRAGDRMRGKPGESSFGLAAARTVAGVAAWYIAGSFVVTISLLGGGGRFVVDETSMRVHVGVEGPAARAGVLDGDRIVSAAGVPIHSWDELRSVVSKNGTEPMVLEIDRGGRSITLTATPEGSPPKLLVGPPMEQRRASVTEAIAEGLVTPGRIVATTFHSLERSVVGSERPELSGPVGIIREVAPTSRRQGTAASFRLMAALASYLLPFVALGSVLYELFSRRRRRPASQP